MSITTMNTCVLFPQAFTYNYMSGSVAHALKVPASYELHLNPQSITPASDFRRKNKNLSLVRKFVRPEKHKLPTLLHVDDCPQIRLLVSIFLKNHFTVVSAESGEEALKTAEQGNLDFILMDIDLGNGINGFETSKKLRELENCQKTPIIALTANDYQYVREDCITSRMNAYIQKPVNKAFLLGTIQELDRHIEGNQE